MESTTDHHNVEIAPTSSCLYTLTGKISFSVYSDNKDWIWLATECNVVREEWAELAFNSNKD